MRIINHAAILTVLYSHVYLSVVILPCVNRATA